MNCKICSTKNINYQYILSNARVFKCKKCGMHYSDYLDDEFIPVSEINVSIDDELRNYLRYQLQNNEIRFTNQVNITLSNLKHTDSPKILDVGIGGGLFLHLMDSSTLKPQSYGIELDAQRLKFAKEEYNLKNIYSKPLQDNFWMHNHGTTFDLITLWDVIEHVNSPMQIFECSSLLLKEGGKLIMDTPCRNTFYHKFGEVTYKYTRGRFPTFLNIMYSNHAYGHKQILSKKDVISLCEKNGFYLENIQIFHELSFPIEFYLKKLFGNKIIVMITKPFVEVLLRLLRINNKMLFVAVKKESTELSVEKV